MCANNQNGERGELAVELFAPCGMYCGYCSGYLAYRNNLPKVRGKISHCQGCRPRDKKCSYIKGHCDNLKEGKILFCYECVSFTCQRLRQIDKRYRINYDTSFIGNLLIIRDQGIEDLFDKINEKHQCQICGEMKSVHNGKCYKCDEVKAWKEK
jgi:hypothetical protein